MFKNGKLNGYGRIIYGVHQSEYYEGYFQDGQKHGYGALVNLRYGTDTP